MARAVKELNHYHLPARIRVKRAPEDGFCCRLALAERIAGLPGIQTVEDGASPMPSQVDVYLQAPGTANRRHHPAILLCTIGREGIAIRGLNEWDRHQVLRGGWGRLVRDHVVMHLPRDFEELEVCWGVLQRAYQYLSDLAAQGRPGCKTPPWNLPRFSRTSLQ
jgi:hypothetical protein